MAEKKPTDDIKERLHKYTDLLREIDNQIERLERLESTMTSPKAQIPDGMPHSASPAGDRFSSLVARKEKLEQTILRKIAEERKENDALSAMIDQIKSPDERALLQLRYFDRAGWTDIVPIIYRDEQDLKENLDLYTTKAFKLHGYALLSLARVSAGSKRK